MWQINFKNNPNERNIIKTEKNAYIVLQLLGYFCFLSLLSLARFLDNLILSHGFYMSSTWCHLPYFYLYLRSQPWIPKLSVKLPTSYLCLLVLYTFQTEKVKPTNLIHPQSSSSQWKGNSVFSVAQPKFILFSLSCTLYPIHTSFGCVFKLHPEHDHFLSTWPLPPSSEWLACVPWRIAITT